MAKPKHQIVRRACAVAVPSTQVITLLRGLVQANGGDPADIPDVPFKMLRPRQAWEMIGVGKTKFYELAKQGAFQLVPIDQLPSEEQPRAA